jgi:3-methylcrotonyl-CoA carboxylase alpha subunit
MMYGWWLPPFRRRAWPSRRLFGTGTVTASLSRPPPALSKVLIANRGEIACRVIRTCRQWGIPTVAIYSSADGPNALHCRMADECYLVGTGPTASESYLDSDAILEICEQTRADAIHPGYGFLSEHAAFSAAVSNAGRRFIGPPALAMEAMASKSRSKQIMDAAGVPTTPGYYSTSTASSDSTTSQDQSDDHLYYQAVERVGFPLLIKAVAGGGGRGMRMVETERDFRAALSSCRNESLASFGDDRVLLERYLRRPRHVEVQVVADSHGNCLHLLERDCSLQRRHQKVIEEAPASDLSTLVRAQMGEMAKRAATAVGYVNAGTVEFLMDTDSIQENPEQPSFYFCEMNTRLQVEHPITELITGIDLVEWQLRIAAGEALPIVDQAEIEAHGHAFEARIYGEHPERNFTPATGTVWHHQPPVPMNQGALDFVTSANRCTVTGQVRVDGGLSVGQNISVYYDSMMSKLIVHGPDRTQALNTLIAALKSYQIAGVPTNIDFLIQCAQHPTFAKAGAITTAFLEEHAAEIFVEPPVLPHVARAAGALVVLLRLERRITPSASGRHGGTSHGQRQRTKGPWSSQWGSWRMGGVSARPQRELHMRDGVTVTCTSNRDGSFDLSWSSSSTSDQGEMISLHVDGSLSEDGAMELIVDQSVRVRASTALRADTKTGALQVRMWPKDPSHGYVWSMDVDDPMTPLSSLVDPTSKANSGASQGVVQAPMPGKISRINFDVGDVVQVGDVVVVMEAMKMEHLVPATMSGILSEIRYEHKDVVDDGAILFIVTDGLAVSA